MSTLQPAIPTTFIDSENSCTPQLMSSDGTISHADCPHPLAHPGQCPGLGSTSQLMPFIPPQPAFQPPSVTCTGFDPELTARQPELAQEYSFSSRRISRPWKTETMLLLMPTKAFFFWHNVTCAGPLLRWLWGQGYDGIGEARPQLMSWSAMIHSQSKLSQLGHRPAKGLLPQHGYIYDPTGSYPG